MSKFNFHTREMGSVAIFDLLGRPTEQSDEVQDVAWRMQKNIRRHRLQRVILNMKGVESMDAIAMRKILAVCIRPKQSVIYGAAHELLQLISDSHVPQNIGICSNEKEVAEKLGPFLFVKNDESKMVRNISDPAYRGPGGEIERRRSHRMHVALPMEIKVFNTSEHPLVTTSIATNISEGGLFAEYLDLEAAEKMEGIEDIAGKKAHIHIFPSAYFPNEFNVFGIIRRKQLVGKQLGLGIEFVG